MRSSLVKDSKNFNVYKKAMEDVEKTDRLGALRVLLRLRKYLQEYEEESILQTFAILVVGAKISAVQRQNYNRQPHRSTHSGTTP